MTMIETTVAPPRIIAWEVTRRCLLACKHCRAAARTEEYPDEFSTQECFRLLDNIAAFASPIIILTGGEPMCRPDIYEIAAYATRLGLRVAMAPCGLLLNDETVPRIVASGVKRISISLDGATAESHDAFRGVRGAFEGCMAGIEAAKRGGLDFQVNTTVCKHNLDDLPDVLALAKRLGASVFNPFLLVPTGRGKQLLDMEISPEEYEQTLQWLAGQQETAGIQIRLTCAPHYQRIVRQSARSTGSKPAGHPGGGHPGGAPAKGCLGGKAFAFISHRGQVQICGFLDVECGDVRAEDYNFQKIWETSEVFRQMRAVDEYHGRCGYCEFRKVCGGCRARAFALTGDYLGEEPYCVHQPKARPGQGASGAAGDELDKRLVSIIQTDFPVAERPFDVLADRLNTTPDDVLARVGRQESAGAIRRLGAVFDSRSLGYVSTLVAARMPAERVDEVAERVNRIHGVTHNYLRDHAYNLWFTLTSPSQADLDATLGTLRADTGIADFHSLPALKVYKIRVVFDLTDQLPAGPAAPPSSADAPVVLSDAQKELVRFLQESVPLVARPFDEIAARLGWPPERVVGQIEQWRQAGVIRRFGAVVNHRRLGFRANGMAVFAVPPERVDLAGRCLARCPDVSHCYLRPPLPAWPYTLYAMVHGHDEPAVRHRVTTLSRDLGAPAFTVLFSTREFKKVSMRYFVEG